MRFNHAYDIAFEVRTDHFPEDVTADELRAALRARLRSMSDEEIMEACGHPFDSFEYEEDRAPVCCGEYGNCMSKCVERG